MAINLKRPETELLAKQIAEITGESLTDAITTTLRERLVSGRPGVLVDELMASGRDCAEHFPASLRSADLNDLLYDERELPK
jgi:antitoxin VapB